MKYNDKSGQMGEIGFWTLAITQENQNTQSGEEKPEQRLFFMYKIME